MDKVKLLIFGLPGSGKTSLAKRLSGALNCVWFNGDEVRSGLYPDLGFSENDRVLQAKRMSLLCDIILRTQNIVIADFVCPTKKTLETFGATATIFMDTLHESRFEDTNRLFERPSHKPTFTIKTHSDTLDLTNILAVVKR